MPTTYLQKWTDFTDITNPTRENTIWVVKYVHESYFLTDEEKKSFLEKLEKGAKYIDVKGNILTGGFLTISQNKELKKLEEEVQKEKQVEQDMFWDNLQYDCYAVWDLYTNDKITKQAVATLYNGGTITDRSGKTYNLEYFRSLNK